MHLIDLQENLNFMDLIDFQVNSNAMLCSNTWYKTYFNRNELLSIHQDSTSISTWHNNSSTGFATAMQYRALFR